ncbi:MAG TPA: aspartate-semialdehyde dehydrogenase [Dehalococcoidia bacterium]|nr:aspartate-semialdehyde dehydrogenase [Dehalococcoidia bacterium]
MPKRSAKSFNIAVVGATGLVGQEFLRLISLRQFPFKGLRLLASHRSAGKHLIVGEREEVVAEATPHSFEDIDLAFFSASSEVSRELVPHAVKAGAVVIDDSKAFRLEPECALVVPEVNAADLALHKGITAIPNCEVTPLVMTLWPLHKVNPIRRVIVDTYQAVSGTGASAIQELTQQTQAVLDGNKVSPHVYPHQIAFNVFPHVEPFLGSGYTREEINVIGETRKIMHAPELKMSVTCARVPVFVGHSLAVHVEFSKPFPVDDVQSVLHDAPGLVLHDEPSVNLYPMPLTAAGRDEVFVGRIREDLSEPNGVALWIAGDNLRKGAALNAIQIAEELIARKLV